MYLTDVQPHHIREFLNRKDKELSRSSIGKLHQILSGAFKEAWRNVLITDNPVAKTPRLSPKAQRPIAALSTDRVQQILAEAEAKGERWHVLYRLLAFTGLRIGEALALQWQSIDLTGKRVLVRRSSRGRPWPREWARAGASRGSHRARLATALGRRRWPCPSLPTASR